MDSNYIKAVLASYFRFKKQAYYLASECGPFNSDFLIGYKESLIEIEIKTSMADFKNDFKKDKHLFYLQNEPCHSICENVYAEDGNGNKIVDDKGCWIKTGRRISEYYKRAKPNMFLFAVPEQLVDSVGAYLVTNYPHYGLLGVNSNQSHSGQINFPVRSVIRPKKLHSEKLHPTIKETIVARMASEIANLRLRTLNEIKN